MTTHPTPEAPAWPVSAMSRIMLESLAEAQADSLRTLSAELAQAKTDLHIATDDAAQMLASTQALSAELAAARAERDQDMHVVYKMSKLLDETVVILRGPETPVKLWSYLDIPEQVAALKAERDSLLARERACATMQEAEAIALVRMGQELAQAVGIDPLASSPSQIVEAVAALRAEVERLKREKAHAIDTAGYMLAAGHTLSNTAFNLKQRVGETLSTHNVAALDSAQRAWDRAIESAKGAPPVAEGV
jgi:hypothetical protein